MNIIKKAQDLGRIPKNGDKVIYRGRYSPQGIEAIVLKVSKPRGAKNIMVTISKTDVYGDGCPIDVFLSEVRRVTSDEFKKI